MRTTRIFVLLATVAALCLLSGCRCDHAATPPQVGTVTPDTINGVPCYVYLPHDYAKRTSGKCAEVFPVLYLQHGMYGAEEDWTTQGDLLGIMDELLQAGQVKEMVIIMPDNCPHRPTAEEERANATNGEWENHFAQFMQDAESRYSIATDPARRAIAGLSMGGYHTMRVSSLLDGEFAYVGMFSAATFVHEAPTSPVLFWIAIGREDFLYDDHQKYRCWLDENHIEYAYYESTGGHTWPNWQDYLGRFLKRLFLE